MWVYRRNPNIHVEPDYDEFVPNLYQVGYMEPYAPDNISQDRFQVVEEYHHEGMARSAVNYLNGGDSSVEVTGVVYNKS